MTVLVTLAVSAEADAEDAAGLVADAAVSTALEVVSTAGWKGICRCRAVWWSAATGAIPGGSKRSKDIAILMDLSGAVVQTPLTRLAPDPLAETDEGTPAGVQRGQWRQSVD